MDRGQVDVKKLEEIRHCDQKDGQPGGDGKRPCILCGKCLEVCPMFAATGREELSPKAKFCLARAMAGESGRDISKRRALKLAGRCLSCGKCENACPLGLCAPTLLADLRAASPGVESAIWRLWVEKARVLWPVMTTLSRVLPRFALDGGECAQGGSDRAPSRAKDGRNGRGLSARIKGLSSGLKAMDPRSSLDPWLKAVRFDPCGKGRKAVVFPGCVAAHARTGWTATAERILGGLGFAVLPRPDFACCGSTLGHAGLKEAQLGMRLRNLRAWRELGRPELVSFCATCRCGLRRYASVDLGWEPGEREIWLAGLVPFSELAGRVEYEWLPGAPEWARQGGEPVRDRLDSPAKVHYHTPCHGAGGGHDASFLRKVLGAALEARTSKNLCCGFGGSLKLEAPELSDAVARRCLDFYGPLPGERILTGCSGCVIQLRANAPEGVDVGHWLEIIV